MAYVTPKMYMTGKIINVQVWNDELLHPLSEKELKLECALTEIVSRGLGTHLDYATQTELVHRRLVNGQMGNNGITAKP